MKLTVLLITYNHQRFIRQAIDSVLAQVTDFDFEILINDDCSTDGTREIVIEYAEAHPDKIRLRLPPVNMNSNLDFEHALSETRGEYIALLDGDDYWTSPHKLQKQTEFLESHPDYALCWHRMEYVDDEGQPLLDQQLRFSQTTFTLRDFFNDCRIITTGAVLLRSSSVTPPLPAWFASNPLGDYALWIASVQHGLAYHLDEVLGAYRVHSEGYWNQYDEVGKAELAAASFHDFFNQVSDEWRDQLVMPVARCWTDFAVKQKRAGDNAGSRRTAKKGLLDCPNDFRLMLLAYVPWAWDPIRILFRLLHSPDQSLSNHIGE